MVDADTGATTKCDMWWVIKWNGGKIFIGRGASRKATVPAVWESRNSPWRYQTNNLVRKYAGKEDAERFYTKPRNVIQGTNRGSLGWSSAKFHSVAWDALNTMLKPKPDMFQLWLSKQCIGICATRSNIAQIQDLLDRNALTAFYQERRTSI